MLPDYESPHTVKGVREKTGLTQRIFGMILGMGKTAVSRFERGERKETFILKEQVSTIAFLVEKDLLKEYVQWRFKLSIRKKL
jgi:transcriptional regulator with XRE-family HTH domain